MGFRRVYDKCNRIIVDFYVADFKRKERAKLQEKDDIISRMDKQHAELMAKYDSLLEKHDQLIGYAKDTKDELAHLTDRVEDHNEQLPEKLTDRFQSRQGARRKRFERSVRRLIVGTSSVQNSSRSKQKRDARHWRKS
jgi:DNA anti-recombination protein RmuC